jgi:DNA-directed RNA polymerase subunit M/transcription elongation factor TFIIS
VYQCPNCTNIGYVSVQNEQEESRCSLCRSLILNEPGTLYAVTVQEAQSSVRELVTESRHNAKPRGGGRGLGIKRRVYYIIESLVDLNRGRPVSIEDVMRECSDAGIDISRAMTFLGSLVSEGEVVKNGSLLTIPTEKW